MFFKLPCAFNPDKNKPLFLVLGLSLFVIFDYYRLQQKVGTRPPSIFNFPSLKLRKEVFFSFYLPSFGGGVELFHHLKMTSYEKCSNTHEPGKNSIMSPYEPLVQPQ